MGDWADEATRDMDEVDLAIEAAKYRSAKAAEMKAIAQRRSKPKNWRPGQMVMTKRDWASMRSDEHPLTIVQDGPDVIACVWADDDQDEADFARLIAAAPSMLSALKRIAEADENSTNSANIEQFKSWIRAVANTAIADAEGV